MFFFARQNFFWLSLGGDRHHFTPKGDPPPHFQLFFFGWGRANFHFWGHTVFLRYFYFFSKNEAKNQQSLQLKWIYRYWGPSVPKIIFIGGIFDLALIWQKIAPLPLKLKNDIRVSGLWPHFLTKMVLTLQVLLNMVNYTWKRRNIKKMLSIVNIFLILGGVSFVHFFDISTF